MRIPSLPLKKSTHSNSGQGLTRDAIPFPMSEAAIFISYLREKQEHRKKRENNKKKETFRNYMRK
jgi:hypothetical protein